MLWDLREIPWRPLESNFYDEVHAYEVIEHVTGKQGDEEQFFNFFNEVYRILKPDGALFATVPAGKWTWADPGHGRVITFDTLAFLSQTEYEHQVGRTPMTDYRSIYTGDFKCIWINETEVQFQFVLQAIKG